MPTHPGQLHPFTDDLLASRFHNAAADREVLRFHPRISREASVKQAAPLHPEVEAVAASSCRKLQPPDIQGSGYVVKSLEAALWAFHDAQDFGEAVLKAVN